ncbi:PREDICTED: uncharacterized protein LOC105564069 [Vollenhovia emeryi]|uniref:uncharacterized protein LOC105564069 n=1 Tax=Vollenhovia emeryi TaxID=411798 RepID=UPI0005F5896B|nr:PREDICTED: uncharacterized protein LOC105564069 [Vollenhovia emeryi]
MLPTVTMDDFLNLEDALRTPEKKKSLMGLFSIITAGDHNVKDCIGKMMKSVMGKSVELEYSGTGRVIHGQSKKNFSGTITYQCIRDILVEKFGNTLDIKKLPGQIGVWLSGAGDREGGRKQRWANVDCDAWPYIINHSWAEVITPLNSHCWASLGYQYSANAGVLATKLGPVIQTLGPGTHRSCSLAPLVVHTVLTHTKRPTVSVCAPRSAVLG